MNTLFEKICEHFKKVPEQKELEIKQAQKLVKTSFSEYAISNLLESLIL